MKISQQEFDVNGMSYIISSAINIDAKICMKSGHRLTGRPKTSTEKK